MNPRHRRDWLIAMDLLAGVLLLIGVVVVSVPLLVIGTVTLAVLLLVHVAGMGSTPAS